MIRPTEIQVLMTAIAFAPLVIWALHGTELPRDRWLMTGLVAMLVAYIATVAEAFVFPDALNFIEHALYFVGALCFAVTSLGLIELARADQGGPE